MISDKNLLHFRPVSPMQTTMMTSPQTLLFAGGEGLTSGPISAAPGKDAATLLSAAWFLARMRARRTADDGAEPPRMPIAPVPEPKPPRASLLGLGETGLEPCPV